jgi:hypothetical protein
LPAPLLFIESASPHSQAMTRATLSPPGIEREPRDHDAYRLLGIHAHSWVLANINMADNKAAFIVFGAAALAAYLRAGVAAWLEHPVLAFAPLVRVAAMALMIASSVCAIIVVAPRARGRGMRSLTYFGGIAGYGSPAEYVQAVHQRTADELGTALLEQCHVIAELAVRKFQWLRWAMWLAGAGFLLVLAAAFIPS